MLCALEYTGATAELLPKPKTQRRGETEVGSTGKNWGINFYWNERKKRSTPNMPESGTVRSLTVSKGETEIRLLTM